MWKTVSVPPSARDAITAVAVEMTIRLKCASSTLPWSTISCANITLPIGALKVVAMPAAAPQATSSFRRDSERSSCATNDPIEPPICAIGPSRPTDAPAPSEIAAPSVFTIIQRRFTRPPSRCTISRKRGNP